MKRIIIAITTISFLNLIGCYSLETISFPEYQKIERENGKPKEIFISAKDSAKYYFDDREYNIRNDTLVGKGIIIVSDVEQPFEGNIPLTEIESFQLEEINSIATIALIAGIVVAFVFTIALGKSMENWRNESEAN